MLMTSLREKTKIVIFVVLIAFVGLIFFDWSGLSGSGGAGPAGPVVATVNGEDVSWDDYRQLRQQFVANFEARTGRSAEYNDFDSIEADTWLTLMRQRVVQQEVARLHVEISDAEILSTLRTNPPGFIRSQFTNAEGQFDALAYSQALANPQLADRWASVEQVLRESMPTDKVQNYVGLAAHVTNAEVRARFESQNAQVKVRYVASTPSAVDLPDDLTDADLRAHFEANAGDYAAGERVVLDYVRVSKHPTADDTTGTREDLAGLREQIVDDGMPFADQAIRWSEDRSAERGGSLGYIRKGDMVPKFEEVAWETPVGDVSEPFSTPFGFHILTVEERKEEDGEEQLLVRHILLRVEASNQTLREAGDRMDDFLEALASGSDFAAAAQEGELTVETTNPFERSAPIPGVGLLRSATRFAFSNPADAVTSDTIEDRNNLYAFRVVERRAGGPIPFEEVKGQVERAVRDARRRETARAALEQAIATGGSDLDAIASALGSDVKEAAAFSRESFVPSIGRRNAFVARAFSLTEGALSGLVEADRGFYVMEVTETIPADEATFVEQQDQIRQQILTEKRQGLITAWLEQLLLDADVVDYRSGANGSTWRPDDAGLLYGGA